jgi:CHASE2 domain-containing sensor protein
MPEKSPETYGLITYLWVFGFSFLGGFVSYLHSLSQGKRWRTIEWIYVQLSALLAGLIVFYICEWREIDPRLTTVFISLASVNSSLTIKLLTDRLKAKVNQL